MTFYNTLDDDSRQDEIDDLRAEQRWQRRQWGRLMNHPDCRDPDHPGCEDCREDKTTTEGE